MNLRSVAKISVVLLGGGVAAALVAVATSPTVADRAAAPATSSPSDPSARQTVADAPLALRAAYIAVRQAEGANETRFHARSEPGALVTTNSARGVDGRFDARGVALRGPGLDGRLEARELRCDTLSASIGEGVPRVDTAPNRVVYDRPTGGGFRVSEWFVNGPLGLEQGFDIARDDDDGAHAGCDDELVVALATPGLRPTLAGSAVRLASLDGAHAFTYGGLAALDATGRTLASRFGVTDGGVTLAVDVRGAVWPVAIDPLLYVEDLRVRPTGTPLSTTEDDLFGWDVALDARTAIIGADGDDVFPNLSQGSVYVFARSGMTWELEARLYASDGEADDRFGWSVALDGDTAVIGAAKADFFKGTDQGSAYVFVRTGSTWSEQAILTGGMGASTDDQFGGSVALDGDTLLVGSRNDANGSVIEQGSATVFVRAGTSWALQTVLRASDGAMGDRFGTSVALSGDTALVGANERAEGAGAAYVFVRAGTTWSEETRLLAPDATADDGFGLSVALGADTALVGAPFDTVGPVVAQGSAHVFVRSAGAWSHEAQLVAADGAEGDGFGFGVALGMGTAVVGAPGIFLFFMPRPGAAYVFARSGAAWSEQTKIVASDPTDLAFFGMGVAVSGVGTLIGAPGAEGIGPTFYPWSGAAYFGRLLGTDGTVCASGGMCESGFCADGVCCDTACVGQCVACAEPGGEGVCAPVAGMPRGMRAACGSDNAVCGGACDGTIRNACLYPDGATACGELRCDATMLIELGSCNGAGGCAEPAPTICEHGCEANACLACTTNEDCTDGAVCAAGACVECAAAADCPDGTVCTAGVCTGCVVSEQCAEGQVCTGGVCGGEDADGCGCHVGGATDAPARRARAALLLLAGFAMLLVPHRRRRRARA